MVSYALNLCWSVLAPKPLQWKLRKDVRNHKFNQYQFQDRFTGFFFTSPLSIFISPSLYSGKPSSQQINIFIPLINPIIYKVGLELLFPHYCGKKLLRRIQDLFAPFFFSLDRIYRQITIFRSYLVLFLPISMWSWCSF